jgi:hypothetical protein
MLVGVSVVERCLKDCPNAADRGASAALVVEVGGSDIEVLLGGVFRAFLHRLRGEILLKRDPANTALAEDALLTAIAIAQQQKARSFELRAALSLAKLYHATDRPADAHADGSSFPLTSLLNALEAGSSTTGVIKYFSIHCFCAFGKPSREYS